MEKVSFVHKELVAYIHGNQLAYIPIVVCE